MSTVIPSSVATAYLRFLYFVFFFIHTLTVPLQISRYLSMTLTHDGILTV